MPTVPLAPHALFFTVTIITIAWFYHSIGKNKVFFGLAILLALAQGALAMSGFFLDYQSIPPKILLAIAPAVVIILIVFLTKKGQRFMDNINYKGLTYLHVIRIPVEIGIFMMFTYKLMPESMTFEGRNFDILSGISAPIIAYYAFRKGDLKTKLLLTWNIICLFLVLQVVITGVLSAPSGIQQFDFDQPNIGVMLFPVIWLPGIIVPIVIFSHLASIRYLLKR